MRFFLALLLLAAVCAFVSGQPTDNQPESEGILDAKDGHQPYILAEGPEERKLCGLWGGNFMCAAKCVVLGYKGGSCDDEGNCICI